jgi:hypothetical protein
VHILVDTISQLPIRVLTSFSRPNLLASPWLG